MGESAESESSGGGFGGMIGAFFLSILAFLAYRFFGKSGEDGGNLFASLTNTAFAPATTPTASNNFFPEQSPARGTGKTVVIDLGHGMGEEGAERHGAQESVLVGEIGQKLQAALTKQGYTAILTRGHGDVRKSKDAQLYSRAEKANTHNADLFISLHANSNANPTDHRTSGMEIFTHRNDAKGESFALAETLGSVLTENREKIRFIKKKGFAVLDERTHGDRPAVLLEMGYINNPKDHARMTRETGQQAIAEHIADGISAYLSSPATPTVAAGTSPRGKAH
jgi:N-acetylmuramoyl-L-alanine amidase